MLDTKLYFFQGSGSSGQSLGSSDLSLDGPGGGGSPGGNSRVGSSSYLYQKQNLIRSERRRKDQLFWNRFAIFIAIFLTLALIISVIIYFVVGYADQHPVNNLSGSNTTELNYDS